MLGFLKQFDSLCSNWVSQSAVRWYYTGLCNSPKLHLSLTFCKLVFSWETKLVFTVTLHSTQKHVHMHTFIYMYVYIYMSSFIATKNELELVNLQEKNSQEYSFLHNVLFVCLFFW